MCVASISYVLLYWSPPIHRRWAASQFANTIVVVRGEVNFNFYYEFVTLYYMHSLAGSVCIGTNCHGLKSSVALNYHTVSSAAEQIFCKCQHTRRTNVERKWGNFSSPFRCCLGFVCSLMWGRRYTLAQKTRYFNIRISCVNVCGKYRIQPFHRSTASIGSRSLHTKTTRGYRTWRPVFL